MSTPGDRLKPGRRLRVQRRKAGLSMEGLAKLLEVSMADLSAMENDKVELTVAAQNFVANTPSKVPKPRAPKEPAPEPTAAGSGGKGGGEDAIPPASPAPEEQPRDHPPGTRSTPTPPPAPRYDAELEAALLKLFAGEAFLVPKMQPDGEVLQEQAVIPGIAQVIGMYDQFDGMIIASYAPGMARAWAQLAAENDNVRRMLIFVTYGGAWRGVMVATAPPLLAIAAHHSLLPTRQVEQPQSEQEAEAA